MREQQYLRFVEEICYLLKLTQPCAKTAIQYFLTFKQYEDHSFDQQILIASSIYLSVKIFQQEVRIRDILNMIYVVTSLYKISKQKAEQDMINSQIEQERQQKQKQNNVTVTQINKEKQQQTQQQAYILLENLTNESILAQIQPQYSLQDYQNYKQKIIQAQQILLRILGFNFILADQNKKQLKRLLIILHYIRVPSTMAGNVVRIFNDLGFIQMEEWLEGVVYFGYLVTKSYWFKNSQQQIKELLNSKEIKELDKIQAFCLKYSDHSKWEALFCCKIDKLDKYAEKLIMFYQGILLQKKQSQEQQPIYEKQQKQNKIVQID